MYNKGYEENQKKTKSLSIWGPEVQVSTCALKMRAKISGLKTD